MRIPMDRRRTTNHNDRYVIFYDFEPIGTRPDADATEAADSEGE